MNSMEACVIGLDWIYSAMEACPFCGKKGSAIQCQGMPDCKTIILHKKGESSINHTCRECNLDLGKGD